MAHETTFRESEDRQVVTSLTPREPVSILPTLDGVPIPWMDPHQWLWETGTVHCKGGECRLASAEKVIVSSKMALRQLAATAAQRTGLCWASPTASQVSSNVSTAFRTVFARGFASGKFRNCWGSVTSHCLRHPRGWTAFYPIHCPWPSMVPSCTLKALPVCGLAHPKFQEALSCFPLCMQSSRGIAMPGPTNGLRLMGTLPPSESQTLLRYDLFPSHVLNIWSTD